MNAPFEGALRAELMQAVRRPPRRRPVAVIALAVTAALITGLVSLASPGTAAADVEISRAGGRVRVLLTDLRNSADDVQGALAEEGIDVQVEAVPVGPSNVGRFVGERATHDGLQDLQHIDASGVTFMGFSLPEDWDGTLTVLLGRIAEDDETYQAFSDAYGPGEPLACTGSLGRPLSAAVSDLAGLDVSIRGEEGSPLPRTDLATALADGRGDWTIVKAIAFSPTQLLISVALAPAGQTDGPAC